MAFGTAPLPAQLLQTAVQAPVTGFFMGDYHPVVGDLDLNGYPDVVIASFGSQVGASVLMNPGHGPLTSPVPIPGIGIINKGGTLTDLNGDGAPDLIIDQMGHVAVCMNVAGTLVYSGMTPIVATASNGFGVGVYLVGDLDGDGLADVVAGNFAFGPSPYTITWWKQLPSSNGLAWTQLGSRLSAMDSPLALADINGDGYLDLVGSQFANGLYSVTVEYWLGDGVGGFGPTQSMSFFGQPWTVKDVDGDGFADLVCQIATGYRVYFGGPQLFTVFTDIAAPLPNGPSQQVFVADVDGDGLPDIIESELAYTPGVGYGTFVYEFRNLGARTFSGIPWLVYTYHLPPGSLNALSLRGQDMAVADFDGDGDLDFVTGTSNWFPGMVAFAPSSSHFGAGCYGNANSIPTLLPGTPYLGNQSWGVGLSGAAPNALGVLAISGAQVAGAGSCALQVDLSPAQLIVPAGNIGLVTTNALGSAFVPIGIPNIPYLFNFTAYAQWGVMDPAGGFLSGGNHFSLSQGRTLVIH